MKTESSTKQNRRAETGGKEIPPQSLAQLQDFVNVLNESPQYQQFVAQRKLGLLDSRLAYVEACKGYGRIPAKYMFVGITAGRLGALKTTVPFTKDASGRIFLRCLKVIGFSKSDEFSLKPELVDCYITNLVKGRCLTKEGLNRLPTQDEIAFWFTELNNELWNVRPQFIAALGGLVFSELMHRHEHYNYIGWKLIPLKHPRWYQSHGALAPNSPAFEKMVSDYEEALK